MSKLRYPRVLFVIVFAWAMHVALWAASEGGESIPVSEDFALRVWEVDDGLPTNSVTDIAQTPDGYLWVATLSGLTRFDGVRFTVFGKRDGIVSSNIWALLATQEGDLWIGTERGGVTRFRQNRFESIIPLPPPQTTTTSFVSSFAEDAARAIWIGMAPDHRAVRWTAGGSSVFTEAEGIGPGADTLLKTDRAGRVWFATKGGCGFFDGKTFKRIDPNGGQRVVLAACRAGGMWAARANRLLHYDDNGGATLIADLTVIGGSLELNALYEDGAGAIWLGTRGAGLYRYFAGAFHRVPISHRAVLVIAEDRERNLWIGTRGGGLNRLRPRQLFLRDAKHGLVADGVTSLCEDASQTLWVALRDRPMVRSIGPENRTFASIPGGVGGGTGIVCADPVDGVWFSGNTGLGRWKGGVHTKLGFTERVSSLLADRQGNFWVGTDRAALLRWSPDGLQPEPVAEGLTRVRALAEDAAGRIWAGTEEGSVFMRETEHFKPVPLPSAKAGEPIRFIVPDRANTVWIGASFGGLIRWRNGQTTRLALGTGLPDEDLRALIIDDSRNFWIASGKGLVRAPQREIEAVLDGNQPAVHSTAFGRTDGVGNIGFVFGRRGGAVRTHDGHLWFATDRGALEVDPHADGHSAPLPPVQIEEIRVNGALWPVAAGQAIILPPKPGPVEFRFTVPRLSTPDRLRFRYRFAGAEGDWIEAQNQRVATFAHLLPGDYRFEVAAAEAGGDWQPGTASALVTVQAAWWQKRIFQASALLLGAAALAGLVRFIVLRRVRARLRLMEQQHALERERARIARDMHDELGASLTQITISSELAKLDPPGAASEHIHDMAAIARRAVTSLDEIVWAVNPRNDTLRSLLEYVGQHAVDFLKAVGITCEIAVPHEVPIRPVAAEFRHHLFLAVKEALSNAAKHSGATQVRLQARFDAEGLGIFGQLGDQLQQLQWSCDERCKPRGRWQTSTL